MALYYRFDPGTVVNRLDHVSFQEAKIIAKGALRLASRAPGERQPESVVMYDDGAEVFRWTQIDRMSEQDAY